MPVGMHRPQPSKWKAVIPFLLILVLVPLLGWGANHLLTSRGGGSASESGTSTSQSAPGTEATQSEAQSSASSQPSESQTPSATPTESATPSTSPSASATPTPTVDHNVVISVLNGTGTSGLAAQKVTILNNAGFAGTSAANATGWSTAVSTVYYGDPDLEVTAQAIAQDLGIATTRLNQTDLGNADVVVVLK